MILTFSKEAIPKLREEEHDRKCWAPCKEEILMVWENTIEPALDLAIKYLVRCGEEALIVYHRDPDGFPEHLRKRRRHSMPLHDEDTIPARSGEDECALEDESEEGEDEEEGMSQDMRMINRMFAEKTRRFVVPLKGRGKLKKKV